MENLQKALKELGFSDNQIEELNKEEADVSKVVSEVRSDLEKVILSTTGKKKVDDEVQNQFNTFKNTTKRRVAKMLNMGLSNNEVDPIKEEDFFQMASDHITIQLANASNNEKLTEELNKYKTQVSDLMGKVDETNSVWEKKLGETEAQWTERFNSEKRRAKIAEVASQLQFDDEKKRSFYTKFIVDEFEKNYNVNVEDFKVTAKDNTVATSPDGKIVFDSITSTDPQKNPVHYIASQYDMLKKSNGGGNPTPHVEGGDPTGFKPTSKASVALAERAAEHARRNSV